MITKKIIVFLTIVLIVLIFSTCATVYIPDDLTPAQLSQRAQEAIDRNRFNIARQYFEALRSRNPQNLNLIITAEYGIGQTHFKQKNYDEARQSFNSVLSYFAQPGSEWLNLHYRQLAVIMLARIDEIENRRRR